MGRQEGTETPNQAPNQAGPPSLAWLPAEPCSRERSTPGGLIEGRNVWEQNQLQFRGGFGWWRTAQNLRATCFM